MMKSDSEYSDSETDLLQTASKPTKKQKTSFGEVKEEKSEFESNKIKKKPSTPHSMGANNRVLNLEQMKKIIPAEQKEFFEFPKEDEMKCIVCDTFITMKRFNLNSHIGTDRHIKSTQTKMDKKKNLIFNSTFYNQCSEFLNVNSLVAFQNFLTLTENDEKLFTKNAPLEIKDYAKLEEKWSKIHRNMRKIRKRFVEQNEFTLPSISFDFYKSPILEARHRAFKMKFQRLKGFEEFDKVAVDFLQFVFRNNLQLEANSIENFFCNTRQKTKRVLALSTRIRHLRFLNYLLPESVKPFSMKKLNCLVSVHNKKIESIISVDDQRKLFSFLLSLEKGKHLIWYFILLKFIAPRTSEILYIGPKHLIQLYNDPQKTKTHWIRYAQKKTKYQKIVQIPIWLYNNLIKVKTETFNQTLGNYEKQAFRYLSSWITSRCFGESIKLHTWRHTAVERIFQDPLYDQKNKETEARMLLGHNLDQKKTSLEYYAFKETKFLKEIAEIEVDDEGQLFQKIFDGQLTVPNCNIDIQLNSFKFQEKLPKTYNNELFQDLELVSSDIDFQTILKNYSEHVNLENIYEKIEPNELYAKTPNSSFISGTQKEGKDNLSQIFDLSSISNQKEEDFALEEELQTIFMKKYEETSSVKNISKVILEKNGEIKDLIIGKRNDDLGEFQIIDNFIEIKEPASSFLKRKDYVGRELIPLGNLQPFLFKSEKKKCLECCNPILAEKIKVFSCYECDCFIHSDCAWGKNNGTGFYKLDSAFYLCGICYNCIKIEVPLIFKVNPLFYPYDDLLTRSKIFPPQNHQSKKKYLVINSPKEFAEPENLELAMANKGLLFSDDNVYWTKTEMNDYTKETDEVFWDIPLESKKAISVMKENSRKRKYIPMDLNFYDNYGWSIKTKTAIPENTIICEYSGDVNFVFL